MLTPIVRRATAVDAPAIAALVNRAYVVESFFVDGDRTSVEEVRDMLARGSFLLAEDGATLLASVYVEAHGERGYFGLLAVEPARQGHGLGRLLVDEAEAACRAAGCAEMDIRVVDVRAELPPFYRRLGYREVRSEPFPEDARAKVPCRFIVMSKPLRVRNTGGSSMPGFKPAPLKPPVTLEDLEKLDIRVGTISAAEEVPASAKLVRLRVDFGDHQRQILSGIKQERADFREIVGRQALFVVNLPPKRMAGELSEGMLFDLGYADGVAPALAVPETAVPNGTRAG